MHEWVKEFPGAIIVCDREGIVIAMNDRAVKAHEEDGGEKLIGRNLLDCHPEPSKSKLRNLLTAGMMNAYTVEKNGMKKFVYQTPWFEKGEYRGFIEFVLEIPEVLPHFVRT